MSRADRGDTSQDYADQPADLEEHIATRLSGSDLNAHIGGFPDIGAVPGEGKFRAQTQ